MMPFNSKFKTLSSAMTEIVGLVDKSPWDEPAVFRNPLTTSTFSFDSKQPACKRAKINGGYPVSSGPQKSNNAFLQQIKQCQGKEEQISCQYKKVEKSPTLIVNKHYHRQGLRERLAKKSLSFDQEWQRKETLKREEHIIKKADELLHNNKELTNTLCLEILDLSDETFHALLLSHPTISLQSVNTLITTAWAKNAEGELQTEKRKKFSSLACLGILPKLLNQQEQLRTVLPSYQKLLAIDQDMVVESILFPMMQHAVVLPKTLLQGIKPTKLLRLTIDWLYGSDMKIKEELISNVQLLLEIEQEYFDEVTGTKFLKILQDTVRSEPSNAANASLFFLFVKKYIHSLREDDIKLLQSVNDENTTLLKNSIARVLEEKVRRDCVEPMDIY